MNPARATAFIFGLGTLALAYGVATYAVVPDGPLNPAVVLKSGVVYVSVASAATVMIRRERLPFGVALLAATVPAAFATIELPTFSLDWVAASGGLWTQLNSNVHPFATGGSTWGLAAAGAGFAFALGVATGCVQQWVGVPFVAIASLPLVEATLAVATAGPESFNLAWPATAGTVTICGAVPLYLLGRTLRRSLTDGPPSPWPPIVTGPLVLGLHATAVGTLVAVHLAPVVSATSTVFVLVTLGPILFALLLFFVLPDSLPVGRVTAR